MADWAQIFAYLLFYAYVEIHQSWRLVFDNCQVSSTAFKLPHPKFHIVQEIFRVFQFFISFQNIDEIPDEIKPLYKTVWEISQKTVLKMAADRGAFIDQSQSLNVHIAAPNFSKLTSMHFYAWKQVSMVTSLHPQTLGHFSLFMGEEWLNSPCHPDRPNP